MLELVLLGALLNPVNPLHFIPMTERWDSNPSGYEMETGATNLGAALDAAGDQLPVLVEFWVPEIMCPITVQPDTRVVWGDCES